VVTTAASQSVGRASRLNLDEYVETTQAAIRAFTGVTDVKVMVNVSPAEPPPTFRVAISLIGDDFDLDVIRKHVASVKKRSEHLLRGTTLSRAMSSKEGHSSRLK
jgi:acetaldehyde dehydrogenase